MSEFSQQEDSTETQGWKVEETMALLQQEIEAARRLRQRRLLTAGGFVGLLLVLIALTNGKILDNLWWILQMGGGFWAADQAVGRRLDATQTLKNAGDPRAVGVLAVARKDGDKAVKYAAEDALQALLPRVRASDAAYITSEQMNALLTLGYHADSNIRTALLAALEQVGDARAVPVVQNLLTDPKESVRERAAQCLPFLEERVRRAQESMTLLRASAPTKLAVAPEQLLRPAVPTPAQTPASELLRSVASNSDPSL